jgi:hypothetical protein
MQQLQLSSANPASAAAAATTLEGEEEDLSEAPEMMRVAVRRPRGLICTHVSKETLEGAKETY